MPYVPFQGNSVQRPILKVYTRSGWAGSWTYHQFMEPLQATVRAYPGEMGSAVIRWPVGNLVRGGVPVTTTPKDILNHYVRISATHPQTLQEESIFYGVIVSDNLVQEANTHLQGIQEIRAVDLAFRLERSVVRFATVESLVGPAGVGVPQPVSYTIQYCPMFNKKDRKGIHRIPVALGQGLVGNRTDNPGGDGLYSFSADQTSIWTADQVIERLLADNAPFQFQLHPTAVPILDSIYTSWDVDGLSVKSALDKILSKKHGIGWYIDVDEVGLDIAYIKVFTFNENAIVVGNITIPGNANTTTFTIPAFQPDRHLFAPIPTLHDETEAYRTILVRSSDKIRVAFSVSQTDGNYYPGWDTATLQDDYTTNFPLQREDTRFEDVFSKFIIPKSWDGKAKDGEGNGNNIVNRQATNDPLDPVEENLNPIYFGDKSIEANLPLVIGLRYDLARVNNEIVDERSDITEVQYLNPLVFAKDTYRVNSSDKWCRVDKLCEFLKGAGGNRTGPLKSGSVSVINGQMALRVRWPTAFYCAGPIAIAQAWPEGSMLDYTEFIATVSMELDSPLQLSFTNNDHAADDSVLVLTVPETGYWEIIPGTVVGTDNDGDLRRVNADSRIIRNDIARLSWVMATAKALFVRNRQKISLKAHYVMNSAPVTTALGTLITDIKSGTLTMARRNINAVVTSKYFDFVANTTTTETDYLRPEEIV